MKYNIQLLSKSMYNESYEDLTPLQQDRVHEFYQLIECQCVLTRRTGAATTTVAWFGSTARSIWSATWRYAIWTTRPARSSGTRSWSRTKDRPQLGSEQGTRQDPRGMHGHNPRGVLPPCIATRIALCKRSTWSFR